MSSANCRAALAVSGGALLRGCARFGVARGAFRGAGVRAPAIPGPLLRPIVVRRTGPPARTDSPAFEWEARNFGRAVFLLPSETAASTARFRGGASDRSELVRFVVRFAGAGLFPASSDRFFVTKIYLVAPTNLGDAPNVQPERDSIEFVLRLAQSICEP